MARNPLHPRNNKDHLCHDLDLADMQLQARDYTSGHTDLTDEEKEMMVKMLVEKRIEVKLEYDRQLKPLEQRYYTEMRNRALQLLGSQPLTSDAEAWIRIQAHDRAVARLKELEAGMREACKQRTSEWVEVSSDDEQL
ncbi:hypothetical protein BT96DRAFT_1003423 [Gymnopus androsaceus JB14]|uniref:Uncharacterized protein n=1 Tax=Gymnopus androsaceus JB14 TaxID=1447944 RepID=A0A6A4GV15_9AGAR|nr:hypothetical protein BT96DRAFT_1003423 [Gymnopus androsaceus JB14]